MRTKGSLKITATVEVDPSLKRYLSEQGADTALLDLLATAHGGLLEALIRHYTKGSCPGHTLLIGDHQTRFDIPTMQYTVDLEIKIATSKT